MATKKSTSSTTTPVVESYLEGVSAAVRKEQAAIKRVAKTAAANYANPDRVIEPTPETEEPKFKTVDPEEEAAKLAQTEELVRLRKIARIDRTQPIVIRAHKFDDIKRIVRI